MRRLFSIILLLSAITITTAQQRGDLFVGADSELAGGRIADLGLSPVLGYQLNDHLQVGLNLVVSSTDNTSYDWFQGYLKWYPTFFTGVVNNNVRTFLKGSFGTSITDSYTNVGAALGVTGFLTKWFYLEPSVGYSYSDRRGDSNRLGVNLACGIRL